MSESIVQVASGGTGPKMHTDQKTIGANAVEDQYVIPGEYPLPTYTAVYAGVATNTANDHVAQLMAGASLKVRIRRIRLDQAANATAGTIINFDIYRLSTAGTGGTVTTPRPMETTDAAAGATGMILPTVKGTESLQLWRMTFVLRQTVAAAGAQVDDMYEWVPAPNAKGIVIPAGTTNGIAIKNLAGLGAAGSVNVVIDFVETAF